MAQIAVAVADGDRAAVVAGGRVGLEIGELLAAGRVRAAVLEHHARAGQQGCADFGAVTVAVRMAVACAVAVAVRVAVLLGAGDWGLGARVAVAPPSDFFFRRQPSDPTSPQPAAWSSNPDLSPPTSGRRIAGIA